MQQALALAREALGTTSPNPAVGALAVRHGQIVGQGYTLPPGQAHAEVRALEQAGGLAQGASLYTTLEPCCTHGRTPPCTGAIIRAGIAEVHMALQDPNPQVAGRGREELLAAGIKVYSGEEQDLAAELYEGYSKHVRTGLPFVIAKFAASLDGRIATHTGDSRWITGLDARWYVHRLRKTVDAIIVGVNTVIRDDPQLTARDTDGEPLPHQPLRVVLDSNGRTPPAARMFDEPGHTLIVSTEGAVVRRPEAEMMVVPSDGQGRVDPEALLAKIGQRGVVSILVEGGGEALGSMFDRNLVDKVVAFIAPMVIGGQAAPSPVAGQGPAALVDAMRLERVKVEMAGEDIVVIGYPAGRG